MATFKDILLAVIALGLPAYLVFRSKRFGLVLGAAALWLVGFLCMAVSFAWAGSPSLEQNAAALEEWAMGGWIYGLVYASLVWLVKQALLLFRRGLLLYHQQTQSGLSLTQSLLQIWRALNQRPEANVLSQLPVAHSQ